MKILCVHGIGHEEADETFEQSWKRAITNAVLSAAPNAVIELDYFEYDARFANSGLGAPEIAEATLRLLTSSVIHSVGDVFRRDRGIGQFSDRLRWTAGMVAQWTADEKLRTTLRKDLANRVNDFRPDIVCAHSLGTLVAYDTFRRDSSLMSNRVLITSARRLPTPPCAKRSAGALKASRQRTSGITSTTNTTMCLPHRCTCAMQTSPRS
ncbi:hypothetical protein [Pseudomonas sp. S2_F03]